MNPSSPTPIHLDTLAERPTDRAMKCAVQMEIHACLSTQTVAKARSIDEHFPAYDDLVEALILLEAEMVLSGNAGSTDYGWKPAIEKTRAAILKAKGNAALSEVGGRHG